MFILCCALFYFVLEIATATGVFKHFYGATHVQHICIARYMLSRHIIVRHKHVIYLTVTLSMTLSDI